MTKEFLPRYSKNEFLLIFMDKPYIPKEPSTTKEICNGMSLRYIEPFYLKFIFLKHITKPYKQSID